MNTEDRVSALVHDPADAIHLGTTVHLCTIIITTLFPPADSKLEKRALFFSVYNAVAWSS